MTEDAVVTSTSAAKLQRIYELLPDQAVSAEKNAARNMRAKVRDKAKKAAGAIAAPKPAAGR